MALTQLERIARLFESKIPEGRLNYVVPDLWNAWDYDGKECRKLPSGELLVNPYRFYQSAINHILANGTPLNQSSPASLSQSEKKKESQGQGGNWIHRSVLYSLMIRTSTTWDHDRSYSLDIKNFDGLKETGSFIKTIALLPLLKKMGVDTIYLLPISRYSRDHKKGDLGSPYAIASFVELDGDLKDDLTGNDSTVEAEFSALVEACHLLGIRVVIDIIPRTNSIHSDLIQDHPDWFYWIDSKNLATYHPPRVPRMGETVSPELEHLPLVYASEDVKQHIQRFRENPRDQDPKRFKALKASRPSNFLDAIEQEYGLSVAPAFSDHINDTQPPWTDITFFRLFLDHPAASIPWLANQAAAPYILFDTIKANRFPGQLPNQPLWEHLSEIIPSYQQRFGIDGARIDMGHALPEALLKKIIDKARSIDPDFAFIAEELSPDRTEFAKRLGYNVIIGNGFWMEPRIWERHLQHFIAQAPHLAIPMFAAAETHDSPRIASREGGKVLARMLAVLNFFLPNLVPFINSGQEVYELQPMNTGVDTSANDRFVLPKDDPQHGKLALFDKYAFHYLAADRWELADHLDGIKAIRLKWIDALTNIDAYQPLSIQEEGSLVIALGYWQKKTHRCLLILANSHPFQGTAASISLTPLRQKANNQNVKGELLYATYSFGGPFTAFSDHGDLSVYLEPGEVKIIEF